MNTTTPVNGNIGVLTSGGDAQGMNAAVRAVVRTGSDAGWRVFAIREGYRGLVGGDTLIAEMTWDDVGGILHRGGTVIGTARCKAFFDREGRREAVFNLASRAIDRLIVIGGDGSLTAADILRKEWSGLLGELIDEGRLPTETAERHPVLAVTGLVGSIDNDMMGTDMTIGADTALNRITEAVDALANTAASHQRTFVVEVMGRHCGYLAVTAAIAGGADWVLFPERPPEREDWENAMLESLRAGREAGRRDTIVVVAEGAKNRKGRRITAEYVKGILEHHLEEEVRLTILGHVQRGGRPSAYDRTMSTLLGHAAVEQIITSDPAAEPQLIGMRGNRIQRAPLAECVAENRRLAKAIDDRDFDTAMGLRGPAFEQMIETFDTLVRSRPQPCPPQRRKLRLAVLTAGGPAPGMNTAVRAAVRFALDLGHSVVGIHNGFLGLIENRVEELEWMSVRGLARAGGSELGTSLVVPEGDDLPAVARTLSEHRIDGLLVIGGWTAYAAVRAFKEYGAGDPAAALPVICLPASINNDFPGSEMAIGADTALNSIVEALDKIKQSAVATRRCFVVEVMGGKCGYLALMAGLASGAERVYLHEEGVTLNDLRADVDDLVRGFERGKRLGLMIRNEMANTCYNTQFMVNLFEEEGGDLFDVRQAILGHLQQGGDPKPFDRIQATRLARLCVDRLVEDAAKGADTASAAGFQQGRVVFSRFQDLPALADPEHRRNAHQWWMDLRPVARVLAQSGPATGRN